MEIGICTSHFVWLLRTSKRRAEAAKLGLGWDDYLVAMKAKSEADIPAVATTDETVISEKATAVAVQVEEV